MSDTSGLPNTEGPGVPVEDDPERFAEGQGGAERDAGAESDAGAEHDAQAAEPAETEPGQGDDVSDAHETGVSPTGQQDVTTPETQAAASEGGGGSEPPPADFDPAQRPSNPDMVKNTEPPD